MHISVAIMSYKGRTAGCHGNYQFRKGQYEEPNLELFVVRGQLWWGDVVGDVVDNEHHF